MDSLADPRSIIDDEIADFQANTDLAELAIDELVSTYRDNLESRHVLVKVIAINALYHARVLDIDMQGLSIHITKIDALDERLKQGEPEVVDEIWKFRGRTKRHYLSIATKFCNWHNKKAYAIYDGNTWEALVAYGNRGDTFAFPERRFFKYAVYLSIVKRFQNSYSLEKYSLKDIDKFLWRVGGRLIEAKKAQPRTPATV